MIKIKFTGGNSVIFEIEKMDKMCTEFNEYKGQLEAFNTSLNERFHLLETEIQSLRGQTKENTGLILMLVALEERIRSLEAWNQAENLVILIFIQSRKINE